MYPYAWSHGTQEAESSSGQLQPHLIYGQHPHYLPEGQVEVHKLGDDHVAAEATTPEYDYRCPVYCPHDPPRKFCYRRDPHQGRGTHRFNCSRCMQHEQMEQAAAQDNMSSDMCSSGTHSPIGGQGDSRQTTRGQDGECTDGANFQGAEQDPTSSSI